LSYYLHNAKKIKISRDKNTLSIATAQKSGCCVYNLSQCLYSTYFLCSKIL